MILETNRMIADWLGRDVDQKITGEDGEMRDATCSDWAGLDAVDGSPAERLKGANLKVVNKMLCDMGPLRFVTAVRDRNANDDSITILLDLPNDLTMYSGDTILINDKTYTVADDVDCDNHGNPFTIMLEEMLDQTVDIGTEGWYYNSNGGDIHGGIDVGDPRPPFIKRVYDATREIQEIQKTNPRTTPLLLVVPDVDVEISPRIVDERRDATAVSIVISYVLSGYDMAMTWRDGMYSLRAIARALEHLMDNDHADFRTRNGIRLLSYSSLSVMPVNAAVGDANIVGVVNVDCMVQDIFRTSLRS